MLHLVSGGSEWIGACLSYRTATSAMEDNHQHPVREGSHGSNQLVKESKFPSTAHVLRSLVAEFLMIWTVPNMLTMARLLAALGVAGFFVAAPLQTAYLAAFLLFLLASATDWLDGRVARAWHQQSRLGEMLDPIADKVLVLITLTLLVATRDANAWLFLPTVAIVFREVFVSGVREYVAGKAIQLSVTRLAKWKTTVQMLSIGGLLLAQATTPLLGAHSEILWDVSIALLWVAAALTLITGWNYLRMAVGSF